jgi:hypothetical protein
MANAPHRPFKRQAVIAAALRTHLLLDFQRDRLIIRQKINSGVLKASALNGRSKRQPPPKSATATA